MSPAARTPRTPQAGAEAAASPARDREFDVTLYGATGFVGRLVAAYLARQAPQGTRIALAGRSDERLAHVRRDLGSRATAWSLLRADDEDAGTLDEMASRSRVVLTTVGPYRPRGMRLVDACVRNGTDYADLTGEVLFMRASIDRHHEEASRRGVRIVHACGFDSIPSDLGVLLLHRAAQRDAAGGLERTTLVVTALRGALSGGTFASMKGLIDELKRAPALRRVVADRYALSPDRSREPRLGGESDLTWVEFDRQSGGWVGPFVMAVANTRVVRRSNALQGWVYGRRFRYREVMGFGRGPAGPVKAAAVAGGLAAFAAGLAFGPTRGLLDRVLPKPGEGPSERTQQRGFFRIDVHGETASGARYVCRIGARGDPGYAATAVMLGETGLALALDRERLPRAAGVLTPATALGTALVDRLTAAGHTYAVERV